MKQECIQNGLEITGSKTEYPTLTQEYDKNLKLEEGRGKNVVIDLNIWDSQSPKKEPKKTKSLTEKHKQ